MTTPVDENGLALGGALPSPLTRFDFADTTIEKVQLNWLTGVEPGDRVLAVPVNGGKDAVVICKVVSSGG
jgi:hypothetical protein